MTGAGAGTGTGTLRHSVDFPATGGMLEPSRVKAFAHSSGSAVSPGRGKKSCKATADSGLEAFSGGGTIGSGTPFVMSGDPDSGPGTKPSLRDLSFFFLLPGSGITGPENASSSEQNALLISPNGRQVLFSNFMPP